MCHVVLEKEAQFNLVAEQSGVAGRHHLERITSGSEALGPVSWHAGNLMGEYEYVILHRNIK